MNNATFNNLLGMSVPLPWVAAACLFSMLLTIVTAAILRRRWLRKIIERGYFWHGGDVYDVEPPKRSNSPMPISKSNPSLTREEYRRGEDWRGDVL